MNPTFKPSQMSLEADPPFFRVGNWETAENLLPSPQLSICGITLWVMSSWVIPKTTASRHDAMPQVGWIQCPLLQAPTLPQPTAPPWPGALTWASWARTSRRSSRTHRPRRSRRALGWCTALEAELWCPGETVGVSHVVKVDPSMGKKNSKTGTLHD